MVGYTNAGKSTLLNALSKADVLAHYGNEPFSVFKPALADLAVEKLAPINAEMRRLIAEEGHVDTVLRRGAERARSIATETMKEVKEIVGFLM